MYDKCCIVLHLIRTEINTYYIKKKHLNKDRFGQMGEFLLDNTEHYQAVLLL
jgi:hypothetical protein